MTQYSADISLAQDPAIFAAGPDWHFSDGIGIPGDGPVTTPVLWYLRNNYASVGQSPHTLWPGEQTLECYLGRWHRTFSRDYTDGSTSFSAWTKVFGTSIVESVNSATGDVVISLDVSGD